MKTTTVLYTLIALLALSACENPIAFKTIVHEDGSLDKTIVLEKAKKDNAGQNYFGINEQSGWTVAVTEADSGKDDHKYRIAFSKHFKSVNDVNSELDLPVDTAFQIHSTFEKKFRWFYTYIHYTETIRPINRFSLTPVENFFNQEDFAFIDRLPGEGTAISKADSVYLEVLNEKISDRFVKMAMFDEANDMIKTVIAKNNIDKRWLDTLDRNKELIYRMIDDPKSDNNLPGQIADTLGIPINRDQALKDFETLSKKFESRLNFMSYAYDGGKYINEIHLPWEIINTNADSVVQNVAVWKPLATKFALREYTMYAACRQMNLWAVLVSIGIGVLTLWLFIRKR
ncbi:MAG TPA: hypothetical protein PLV21_10045 [Cyclobacteriaceae bacterium]|nr:hypothetical protein [Cyclobacteriaceae bacterium]HRJ82215.1 hypothetical protein [Cyclobacteriaceae bacterium]